MKPRPIPRGIPKTFVTPISRGPRVAILRAGDVAAAAGFDHDDVQTLTAWAHEHGAIVSASTDLDEAAQAALDAEVLCVVQIPSPDRARPRCLADLDLIQCN